MKTIEIIEKLTGCASVSGLFYLFGILLLLPSSFLFTYLRKKEYSDTEILNKGHNVILLIWLIAFILITYKVFSY